MKKLILIVIVLSMVLLSGCSIKEGTINLENVRTIEYISCEKLPHYGALDNSITCDKEKGICCNFYRMATGANCCKGTIEYWEEE